MPDGGGMSGLDMSEVGAAAQKAGQQAKKIANPFLQAAKSQITGKPVQSQGQKPSVVKNFGFGASDIVANIKSQVVGSDASAQLGGNKQSGSIPPTDTPTSGTFDIAGFAKSLKQQVAGVKPATSSSQSTSSASGSSTPAQSSLPPSEKISPQKTGTFEDQFQAMKKMPNVPQSQQPSIDIANQEEIAKKQAEDRQKYQTLLNKLHQMQTEDVMKAGESDKKKDEEEKHKKEQQEVQEKEQKEQEKDEKMQMITAPAGKKKNGFMGYKKIKKAMGDMLGAVVKRKQGSHEGSGGKG